LPELETLLRGKIVVDATNPVNADWSPMLLGQENSAGVASNDAEARRIVADLARSAGFASLEVGPLASARHLEAMAHLNIQVAVGMQANAAFVFHQIR
jgi:predicted dinucleotide-binding enzyme